jgi:hypothetical protein
VIARLGDVVVGPGVRAGEHLAMTTIRDEKMIGTLPTSKRAI